MDIPCRLSPYQQRLLNKVPAAADRAVLRGAVTRIPQSISGDEPVTMCILPNTTSCAAALSLLSSELYPSPEPKQENESKAKPRGHWQKAAQHQKSNFVGLSLRLTMPNCKAWMGQSGCFWHGPISEPMRAGEVSSAQEARPCGLR